MTKNAKFSNNSLVLKRDFNLKEIKKCIVCPEAYVKAHITLFYIPIPNYIRSR